VIYAPPTTVAHPATNMEFLRSHWNWSANFCDMIQLMTRSFVDFYFWDTKFPSFNCCSNRFLINCPLLILLCLKSFKKSILKNIIFCFIII